MTPLHSNEACKPAPDASTPGTICARSSDLLGATGMLKIEHQGGIYVLRATSKGGLILTK